MKIIILLICKIKDVCEEKILKYLFEFELFISYIRKVGGKNERKIYAKQKMVEKEERKQKRKMKDKKEEIERVKV